MTHKQTDRFWRSAAQCLLGGIERFPGRCPLIGRQLSHRFAGLRQQSLAAQNVNACDLQHIRGFGAVDAGTPLRELSFVDHPEIEPAMPLERKLQ